MISSNLLWGKVSFVRYSPIIIPWSVLGFLDQTTLMGNFSGWYRRHCSVR
jgi:hypothetical protein